MGNSNCTIRYTHYFLYTHTGRRRAGWAFPAYVGVSLLPARGGAHLRERPAPRPCPQAATESEVVTLA